MVTTIGIRENIKNLNDLEAKFNLQQTEDDNFFPEWYEDLPEISDRQKASLDKIRRRYVYHRITGPLLEGTINLLIVLPLLEIAGFFDPPFKISSPELVEFTIDDPDELIRGLIDVLVLKENLWVLVIESKCNAIPSLAALPQILAYMVANCSQNKPTFGMITNGDEFIFLKLLAKDNPEYDLSDSFLLFPKRNKFYDVLKILKRLSY